MAVPSDVVNVTEVVTSTGFESVIVKITPLPSNAEEFAMLKTAASLLVIVPVAVLAPEIVTLSPPSFNPPSVAVKVSLASTLLSAVVLIVIVREVCPAANETTCEVTAV